MSISYFDDLATVQPLSLLKLLFCRWHGSILKLLWKDLIVFFSIFCLIQLIYRFIFNDELQVIFEMIVDYAHVYQEKTPLSFLLGFFVANVFDLWWKIFKCIPWPITLSINVTSSVHGFDEVGRAIRRTIVRYACLSITMVFRALSPRVKQRFPRMNDMVEAGLINEDELGVLEVLDGKFPGYGKYWIPICWAASLASKARDEGRIKDDFALKTIVQLLTEIQASCGDLMHFALVYIPLVQTQVVVIAVYSYFLTALFAHQNVKSDEIHIADRIEVLDYIPLLLVLKFIFYMGWLKVAETMMNPFGDDDDDFDINTMIDKNLQVSYIIVDEMHAVYPELLKDQFWDEIPQHLPDRGRETSDKILVMGDIFDVDEKDGIKKVVFADDYPRHSRVSIDSLRPRADVIDENYRKLENVETSQTTLEREMDRIQIRKESSKIINFFEDENEN